MLYFDERPVARLYEAKVQLHELRWWRTNPEFSQRNTITVAADGRTMQGVGEMSKDGGPWGADLALTYTRIS